MRNLAELADSEISRMFGGLDVFSYRPEELPCFHPSDSSYTPAEEATRIEELEHRLKGFYPSWDLPPEKLRGYTRQRFPDASLFWNKAFTTPEFLIVIRPSTLTTPQMDVSHRSGLPLESIHLSIPKNHHDFISLYKALGPIDEEWKGLLRERGGYESELYAESFAYDNYLTAGGDPDVIAARIQQRALAGFLRLEQPLAPTLHEKYVGKSWKHQYMETIGLSYMELKLRTLDRLNGENMLKGRTTGEILDEISQHLRRQENIKNPGIVTEAMYKIQDFLERDDSSWNKDKRAVFSALQAIVLGTDIDETGRKYGRQILEAGRNLVPELMPREQSLHAAFEMHP
jgi:hypothetical protein